MCNDKNEAELVDTIEVHLIELSIILSQHYTGK
jgi:hypothetical protein